LKPRFFTLAAWLTFGHAAFLCAQTQTEPLRFVAYNLENYTRQDRVSGEGTVETRAKPEANRDVIAGILAESRPDVIGVCEMGDLGDVEDLRARLAARGVHYPHMEWVDAADPDRHLTLLSRLPIVSRQSQRDLVYTLGELELPVLRGILDVTIQAGEYRLRFIGCHLKSKRETLVADEALMRRNEAHLVRKHVESILADDPRANLLVYGDFNADRQDASIRAIQGMAGAANYLSALRVEDSRGLAWTHFWDAADSYSRIDFLFASPGLVKEIDLPRCRILDRADWEQASDHRPLLATLNPVERN